MKRRQFIKSALVLSTTIPLIKTADASEQYKKNTSLIPEENNYSDDELSIALISDLHINSEELFTNLTNSIDNIKTKNKLKHIIIPGDLGENLDYIKRIIHMTNNKFNKKNETSILVLGNHDVRGPDKRKWITDPTINNDYYNIVIKEYRNMCNLMKETEKHSCFDLKIKNHHFIALNTDRGLKDQAYFNDNTIRWFESKLSEYTDGKKIVIVHQALNDTHWRSNLYGGFGEQDSKIKKILSKYPETIIICGHIHNGFGVIEAMKKDFGTLIEVPSFNRTENGLIEKGYGFIMKIKKNNIVLEAWNFLRNEHYPEYDIDIPTKKIEETLKSNKESMYSDLNKKYDWEYVISKVRNEDELTAAPGEFGMRKLWPQYKWDLYS